MKLKNILMTTIAGASLFLGACSMEDIEQQAKGELTKVINEQKDDLVNQAKDKAKEYTDSFLNKGNKGNNEIATSGTLEYKVGSNPVVDFGKSKIETSTWKSSHVEYSNLDKFNRPGKATAYLDKSNYGKSENRAGQRWQPAGWNNQKVRVEGKSKTVQDRGHLIAYTLTFKFDDHGNYSKNEEGSLDNPLNLTTQSAYSNQVLFQRYEEKVRSAIQANKKVIYQVTPLYGKDELMPRAYEMQAVSTDKSLNFNVMIYNVQPGVEFNYKTGKPTSSPQMVVPK